jgi:hypothetical protein
MGEYNAVATRHTPYTPRQRATAAQRSGAPAHAPKRFGRRAGVDGRGLGEPRGFVGLGSSSEPPRLGCAQIERNPKLCAVISKRQGVRAACNGMWLGLRVAG